MSASFARHRRRPDNGFTLIELLIVIIILGILSAVVVFAVKGTNDKGTSAAVATDRRILRTAMETFCAKNGSYPTDPDVPPEATPYDPMQVLVDQKFLSNRSEHYGLATGRKDPLNPDAFPEGNCAGMGYKLIGPSGSGTQTPPTTNCLQVINGVEELVDVTPAMVDQGYWCLAAGLPGLVNRPSGDNSLVKLDNGKVLAILEASYDLPPEPGTGSTLGHRTALFDPTAGPRGEWTAGPVAYVSPEAANVGPMSKALFIEGDPATCGSCGKALVHFRAEKSGLETLSHWKLYDPGGDDGMAGTEGAWSTLQPPSPHYRGDAEAIRLVKGGCFPHCGKLLIVGRSENEGVPGPPAIELYDPVVNAFTTIGLYSDPTEHGTIDPSLTELDDGRVLLVLRNTTDDSTASRAVLINPENGSWVPVPGDPHPGGRYPGPYLDNYLETFYYMPYRPVTLPGGGVFFGGDGTSRAQIFLSPTPVSPNGSWAFTASCATSFARCTTMALLPDDRVLVGGIGFKTLLFDINQDEGRRWTETADRQVAWHLEAVALLSETPCAPNCNKVLAVADDKAEIYTPPQ